MPSDFLFRMRTMVTFKIYICAPKWRFGFLFLEMQYHLAKKWTLDFINAIAISSNFVQLKLKLLLNKHPQTHKKRGNPPILLKQNPKPLAPQNRITKIPTLESSAFSFWFCFGLFFFLPFIKLLVIFKLFNLHFPNTSSIILPTTRLTSARKQKSL